MSSVDSTNATNASLLARALMRDERAWQTIVDLYGPLVATWCKRSGMRTDFIADLTQEIFINVLNSLGSFRSTPGDGVFRAWLWRITRNKLTDFVRSETNQFQSIGGSSAKNKIAQVTDPHSIPVDEPTDSVAIGQLMHRALMQVQNEFESRTWHAFWRSAVDGIANSVIAQELGVSEAAVRQSRSRVVRRLRIQLGDAGMDAPPKSYDSPKSHDSPTHH